MLLQIIAELVDKVLSTRRIRPVPAQSALSKREFGVKYDLSVSSVEKEIREGRLEAKKAGHRTIITAEAQARWEAALPSIEPASEDRIAALAEATAEANRRYLTSRPRTRPVASVAKGRELSSAS